jgi:hypothetical protein
MSERQVWYALRQVIVASPRFATAPLVRSWHLRWGATSSEVEGPMPGDDIVPRASFSATRAVTIDAPPAAVWPWLVQLGFGRAGFYSYDLFDNAACPSADSILAEYQGPKVGDWVPMVSKINETTAFRIKAFEPHEWLLWEKPNSTWALKLVPLDVGHTRLLTRLKQYNDWGSPLLALVTVILFEFGDFPMMRQLLLGVKARAEREAAEGKPMYSRGLGEFFAEHPGLYAAALVGAGGAGVVFTLYAVRASGPRRRGWMTLAALQVIQAAGIVKAKAGAARRQGPMAPREAPA